MTFTDENNKRVVLQIRLDKELKEEFQRACKERSINSSELLRKMIVQWLIRKNIDF